MQVKEYIDVRDDSYYVAGSRIGLDVVFHDFQRGRSPESIFQAYPSVGSLAKIYGAIAFILDHPSEVQAYLKEQDRKFERIKAEYPMPAEMIERYERGRKELSSKDA